MKKAGSFKASIGIGMPSPDGCVPMSPESGSFRKASVPVKRLSIGSGAVHHHPDRVERGRAADIEHVALGAAEGAVGDDLRHLDLADQGAVGMVAMDAV